MDNTQVKYFLEIQHLVFENLTYYLFILLNIFVHYSLINFTSLEINLFDFSMASRNVCEFFARMRNKNMKVGTWQNEDEELELGRMKMRN